jgi:hypothetical protein
MIGPEAKSGDEPVVPGAGTTIQTRKTPRPLENSERTNAWPSWKFWLFTPASSSEAYSEVGPGEMDHVLTSTDASNDLGKLDF